MWYKVIIFDEPATWGVPVSDVFEWDASSALLPDVPLEDGKKYSVNVAAYYDNGYSYSDVCVFRVVIISSIPTTYLFYCNLTDLNPAPNKVYIRGLTIIRVGGGGGTAGGNWNEQNNAC